MYGSLAWASLGIWCHQAGVFGAECLWVFGKLDVIGQGVLINRMEQGILHFATAGCHVTPWGRHLGLVFGDFILWISFLYSHGQGQTYIEYIGKKSAKSDYFFQILVTFYRLKFLPTCVSRHKLMPTFFIPTNISTDSFILILFIFSSIFITP